MAPQLASNRPVHLKSSLLPASLPNVYPRITSESSFDGAAVSTYVSAVNTSFSTHSRWPHTCRLAYCTVQEIILTEQRHAVATYLTPPGHSCRGVIRGVDVDFTDAYLKRILQTRSSSVPAACLLPAAHSHSTPTRAVQPKDQATPGSSRAPDTSETTWVENVAGKRETHTPARLGPLPQPVKTKFKLSNAKILFFAKGFLRSRCSLKRPSLESNAIATRVNLPLPQTQHAARKSAKGRARETLTDSPVLRGYRVESFFQKSERGIATCIARYFSYTKHEVRPDLKVEHIWIELVPNARLKHRAQTPIAPRPPIHTEEDPLVSPFTSAEVRAVLTELNCRSAPGPDGITNKLIKNLADEDIDLLTKYINEVWESGAIPLQWREAALVLIPKPDKPFELGSLKPTSLTSCSTQTPKPQLRPLAPARFVKRQPACSRVQHAHPLVRNTNELAHSQARDLTRRVMKEGGPRPKGEPWRPEPLLTHNKGHQPSKKSGPLSSPVHKRTTNFGRPSEPTTRLRVPSHGFVVDEHC
ncbi:hypothetical protein HPB50_023188 [Hyalomma asiaticum]|uniref:Uncharacterized protein n=1 Tax=Hyalomma asiaticum TaxID=266040 RepID=A0ACB7TQ97_HYAAI|nr:hypothetical protein HPB50_023188 [Hyalomma asiaticum]